MKRHILGPAIPGLSQRRALCGQPEDRADCVIMHGKVYDRKSYEDVPTEDVCISCLNAAGLKEEPDGRNTTID